MAASHILHNRIFIPQFNIPSLIYEVNKETTVFADIGGWKCLKKWGGGTMNSKIPYSNIPPRDILGGLRIRNIHIIIPP